MTENSLTDKFSYFDENYAIILERVTKAAQKSGKKLSDIKILAATKTVPVELINYAISKGIRYMGENRVQEFQFKYEALQKENTEMHFIGQLQSNKVKYIADKVCCIQSVDSVKLAAEIAKQARKHNKVMDILIEVNIGREANKGGVMPEVLFDFIEEVSVFEAVSVKGLMAIPPICENKSELCGYFEKMQQYYVDITAKKIDNVYMHSLSMGMSGDFDTAIECGANMVRVGSSLFGKRT